MACSLVSVYFDSPQLGPKTNCAKLYIIDTEHGIIYNSIRTEVTCKKIPCYMRDLACRWFIIRKGKIF